MENILDNLNPAQRAAVTDYAGPSLIIAGAGSGKTRVLTSRIAYMIERGVAPHTILALTFTNKAAAEMRERIDAMIGPGHSRNLWMGTFHSIFLRILRAEAERLGYPPTFTIYDTTDSVSLVKLICKELGLDDKDKYKPRNVLSKISRLKNDLVTPEKYAADSEQINDDRRRGTPQFLEIYRRYTARCKANGAMDFDDILLNMVVLLKNHPDALQKYQSRFAYVLVDEYQDTNHVQYLIVKALAAVHHNICVVGDDSQSIYSFRGARIENILGFRRDFPQARIHKLEQNYRSTRTIVSAANGVIARNRGSRELKKECFSEGAPGERIKLLKAFTDREEAELVANEIRRAARDCGAQWSDIAVLYRVNALSRGVEESLRRRDIPYKIYRGHSFFDRREIKDLLAYLRLIVNPRDDEAFRRVVNYPARGIGDVTLGRLTTAAREQQISLWEAAMNTDDKKIRSFMELVRGLSLERAGLSLYEFGRLVATRTGILGVYKSDGSAESISALENIEELLNSMAADTAPPLFSPPYKGGVPSQSEGEVVDEMPDEVIDGDAPLTLEDWLSNVALMTDMDAEKENDPESRNRVTLMTVHSAKGLEFAHVFIVGLEEELFPSVRDGDSAEIEEERRLFYVALTRARERSYMSFAQSRFIHGNMAFRRPSRFVREIDPVFLDGSLSGDDDTSARGTPAPARGIPLHAKEGWRAKPAGVVDSPSGNFRKVDPNLSSRPGVQSDPASLSPGTRVRHAKFGPGTVNEVEPMAGARAADDLKVTVTFDSSAHGRKTLLSKFAKLEVI